MAPPFQLWTEAMRRGRFEEAWDYSATVLAERDPTTRDDPALPYHLRWVWDGRPFDGRHVLVRCYHGLGDTLQSARFLPLLARRARSLTVEAQPELIPLLSGLAGVDRWVPFDPAQPSAPAECDLEITELSFALRTGPADVPAPYLASAQAVLPRGTIGLCHRAGDWDPARSVPSELFASLCERHCCLTLAAEPSALKVLNPKGCPLDMAATAALVAGVDLVITVDTMIAHLTGALGRPVWLLLKAEPDWRWAPGVQESPWYSSMRLFRQAIPGDWPSVLADVERALERRTFHEPRSAAP